MCKNPQPFYLPEEQREIKIACRKCWQCRENRVNDLVGRALAEEITANKTYAVTLTYGGGDENPHAVDLVYADVQKFLKRLRRAEYTVRYMVAGEYGSKRARAHWHIILFFYGKTPVEVEAGSDRKPWEIVLPRWDNDPEARINWAPWEHGFVYFQEPDYGSFQYVLKYALKDLDEETGRKNNCSYSKKPPLGHQYFQERARQYVEQGLIPHDWEYSFRDVKTTKGKIRKFWLNGKTRENFLDTFMAEWETTYGDEPPVSELFDGYLGNGRADFGLVNTPESKGQGLFKVPRQYPVEDSKAKRGKLCGIPCEVLEHGLGYLTVITEGNDWWHVQEGEQDAFVRRWFKPKTAKDALEG